MSPKMVLLALAACVCVASAGLAPALSYAHPGLVAAPALSYAAAPALSYAAAPALSYAAAPALSYAAAPVAVAAPIAIDNSHFSYGYLQPTGGHVAVSRTGPFEAHSYSLASRK